MSAATVTAATVDGANGEKQTAKAEARWEPVLTLPCCLSVDISLPGFKVSDFVRLRPGTIATSGWDVARDVPLRVNGVLIGWGELEEAGNRLAIRVTELA